jgi:hypothetical protein
VVKRPAVELDDWPLLAPDAVDLQALDPLVRLRRRKAAFEEHHFELAASDGCAHRSSREQGANRWCAWAPWVASKGVMEGKLVQEVLRFRLVHRAFQLTGTDRGRQVEESSGYGGHRDGVAQGDLVGRQQAHAQLDARRRPPLLGTVRSIPASDAIPRARRPIGG